MPKCSKCPSCCRKSTCGCPSAKVLAGLALPGYKSKSSLNSSGGLPPALQRETSPDKVRVNRLFLVPKPNNKWRPILDLCQLNWYLATSSFKMETPETIRLSLQKGEWVTSLDFSDAYFHIPIGQRLRKFLRFYLNSQAYQFKALPFGLSTTPLEFTKVAKEVKLMAQARGIRIHQYLDDWLLRAPCPETCPDPLGPMPQVRVGSEYDQVRAGSSASIQLCRLPFRPLSGVGQTDPGEVDRSVSKDQRTPNSTGVFG